MIYETSPQTTVALHSVLTQKSEINLNDVFPQTCIDAF